MEEDKIEKLVNFLSGAGPDEQGRWFDEASQQEQGSFWWRRYLRQIERQHYAEMASLQTTNRDLYEALERCLNFIANTESEIGETLESGDMARAALARARGEA